MSKKIGFSLTAPKLGVTIYKLKLRYSVIKMWKVNNYGVR